MGQGFELSPMGFVPIGTPVSIDTRSNPSGYGALLIAPPAEVIPVASPAQVAASALQVLRSDKPLTGKEIVAQAKAAIKRIDKQLAEVPDLEQQRAGLRALVAAYEAGAKAKLSAPRWPRARSGGS